MSEIGEVKTSLGSADGDGSGEYLDRPGNQVSTAGRREPLAAALPVDAGTGIRRVEVAAGLATQPQLKDGEVSGTYWQALEWSRQVTGGEAEPAKAK
jgi:hypothetical protein